MPDRPDYFRCPICHGTSCESVVVRRPNGSLYRTEFFRCAICTLMFTDPLALTRGYEDRPRRPAAPATGAAAYQAWAKINQARKQRE